MRPSDFPNSPAVRLLTALSARHDRRKPGSAAPTLRVEFGDATSTEIDIAERLLVEAEKSAAIMIERPKRMPHILHRIRLGDPAALSIFLGRESAATKASGILDRVAPLLEGAASWIQDEIGAALERWSRGDRAFRIDAGEVGKVEDLTRLLLAIDRGVDGRDLRTFSNAAGVDSKAFERHQGSIIQIARRAFGWDGAPAQEVLALLGFRPFFQLVHISGPVAIPAMKLDATEVIPFVGLPPHATPQIELTRPIDAVLTIENLTSFNRHTREVRQPNVVVIYSGGFPSRPVVDTLHRLLELAPAATIHHWGDIDVGGIRIFRNIEQRLARSLRPHLMERRLAEAHGRPVAPARALARMAEQETGIRDLASYLAEPQARLLEQESIDPSPLVL